MITQNNNKIQKNYNTIKSMCDEIIKIEKDKLNYYDNSEVYLHKLEDSKKTYIKIIRKKYLMDTMIKYIILKTKLTK